MAQEVLTTLKEHPDAWTRVDTILEYSQSQQTKYFALQILENVIKTRWKVLPRPQCEGFYFDNELCEGLMPMTQIGWEVKVSFIVYLCLSVLRVHSHSLSPPLFLWCWKYSVFGAVQHSVCACMHEWSHTEDMLSRCLTNCLWEFYKIYNFGAVGDKDEVIRLWDQEVKGQDHCETTNDRLSTLGGFFSLICGMHGHILM